MVRQTTVRRSPRLSLQVTPAMPVSIACHVSAAAARRAGRPRARATARSWRRRRSVIASWCSMAAAARTHMNPARYDRNCADLAQPIDASGREHFGKSVLEQRRPGGLAGAIVGHVGEHVGAQVAVVRRSSGADQRAQRRDRHDEPVGGVVVPPGHDRAGDTQGQGGRSIEGGDGHLVTDSDPEILCRCPAEDDLVRSFGITPVRHGGGAPPRIVSKASGSTSARRAPVAGIVSSLINSRLDTASTPGVATVRSTVSSTPNIPFDSLTSSAAAP